MTTTNDLSQGGQLEEGGAIRRDVGADDHVDKFALSKRRWVILFGLCLFGLFNGFVSANTTG